MDESEKNCNTVSGSQVTDGSVNNSDTADNAAGDASGVSSKSNLIYSVNVQNATVEQQLDTVATEAERDKSRVPYSIEDITFITGAWKDYKVRDECFTKGCKWAPDGTCVVTNSADNRLRIFDLPLELHCQGTWKTGHNLSEMSSVLSISAGQQVYDYSWYPLMSSMNPLSCCLVSTSKDNPVHMWDAFTGELRCTYRCYNHLDEIVSPHSVTFDTTGQKLYCGLKNMIKIFRTANPGRDCETRNLKITQFQTENQIGIVSCIAVNPNIDSVYAVGTFLKTVGLYSESEGELLCLLRGHKGGVTHVAFSPDGTKLFSGGRKDPEIICWDLRNPGAVLCVLEREVTTNQRMYFDISPNGYFVMSGCSNGTVKIWNIQQPPDTSHGDPILQPIKTFQAHNDCVNGLSIHRQYPVLATSSGQRHFDDIAADSSSDTDQPILEGDSDCGITSIKMKSENSLKLWWLGPSKHDT